MTNEDNSNKRTIKRRRMIPKTDSDLENNNREIKRFVPQNNDRENVAKILQPKENKESENMKKYNFTEEYKKLMQSITDSSLSRSNRN